VASVVGHPHASQHANLDAAGIDHLPAVGLKGLSGVLMEGAASSATWAGGGLLHTRMPAFQSSCHPRGNVDVEVVVHVCWVWPMMEGGQSLAAT